MARSRVLTAVAAVLLVAAPALYMIAAAPRRSAASSAGEAALTAPLPAAVPPGTTLIVGDPITQHVLEHTGWIKDVPFKIKWVQGTGGPAVTELFHAKALDVGSAADVPPIHARWVGIPTRIVAVALRQDPLNHPLFVFAAAPRSNIQGLADLRGKKIAFSPGQVQGEIVLRTLKAAGLTPRDVTLVELPSTGDVYLNALAGGGVDAAPIGAGVPARRYLANYGKDGARLFHHSDDRDDLTDLYAREDVLRDPAKAAALAAYVKLWARASAWIQTHPDEWIATYYVKNQGVTRDDGAYIVRTSGVREVPRDWRDAVNIEQAAIDLLSRQTGRKVFDAGSLFDRRFETLAADAYAAGLAQAGPPKVQLAVRSQGNATP
jgi:sulfonate transport system substrate-binding protein